MIAPCSVKARGRYLMFLPLFKVADCDLDPSECLPSGSKVASCDLEAIASSQVSWNMKSSGNRSMLRFTCSPVLLLTCSVCG